MLENSQNAGLKLGSFPKVEDAWKTLPVDSFKQFLNGFYSFYKKLSQKSDGRFYRKYDKDYKNEYAVNISIDNSILRLWENNKNYLPQTLINARISPPASIITSI